MLFAGCAPLDDSCDVLSPTGRRAALRAEYVARVNRVLDHIERHLTGDLSLAALAEVAGFSPYHFHRIFTSVAGETPGDFIGRIRVERAASALLVRPSASVTRIALECGFSGPAAFARAFRASFGMTATAWRAGGHLAWMAAKDDRVAETHPTSRGGSDRFGIISEGLDLVTRQPWWRLRFLDQEPVTVTLQQLPELHIAYIRYVGRYQGDGALFARLFASLRRWATPRGLLAAERGWWICVYHDPTVTSDDRLRVTVGLTVPPGTKTSGPVSSMTVDGGRYAVGRFTLRASEYAAAWTAMMVGWLPESGCRLDDRHCFERFPGVDSAGGCCDATPSRPLPSGHALLSYSAGLCGRMEIKINLLVPPLVEVQNPAGRPLGVTDVEGEQQPPARRDDPTQLGKGHRPQGWSQVTVGGRTAGVRCPPC